jgi:pimeloyl-ACP methyl ester carboxylesterase
MAAMRTRNRTGSRPTRRTVLKSAVATAVGGLSLGREGAAQNPSPVVRSVHSAALTIGFEESGPPQGVPVVLLHGFPDDVRAWDDVVPPLASGGCRVIVPYLRGHGLTRLRDTRAPRTGEQAAIAQDLLDLLDLLGLSRVAVAGYDWGGRAAGIVSALHPNRVRAAVLIGGYTIQDTLAPPQPAAPARERALWYQWYFNTERGRAGLAANRRPLCRLLWETWSPTWKVTDEAFDRTAPSFDNPDFVDVVIHSYRHRNVNAPGDPQFADIERQLAARPPVRVPTVVLYGGNDGVSGPPPSDPSPDRASFPELIDRRIIEGAGHFLPRERPGVVASAVLEALRSTR